MANIFDLAAKISLDSSEYNNGISASEGKMSAFGAKLSSGIKSAVAATTAALTAATTAVVAFAKESVQAGAAFDTSMSQVLATMGYSVEELNKEGSEANETMQKLRDFAQEMGSTTVFSATQAADALNYMALAGYDAETSMQMLPNVLNLAAAGAIDLASASDMVTDAQSALGLNLEETAIMVDQMAQTASKSNTSVAQLGEAFLTIGASAQNLSGGTQELSSALGILANSGIKGSEAGIHLRNILLALNPSTDAAAEAFENMGLNAYDSNGNLRPINETLSDLQYKMSSMTQLQQSNLLSSIFNKTDLAAIQALLSGVAIDTDKLTAELYDCGVQWDKYTDLVWASDGAVEGLLDDSLNYLHNGLFKTQEGVEQFIEYLQYDYDMSVRDARTFTLEFIQAAKNGESDFNALSAAIEDAEGAASDMADVQLDNLNGDITLFKSALEGAQITISDQLTPNLREFVQFGSAALSELTEAFKDGGLDGAMTALGDILSQGINMIIQDLPTFTDAGLKLLQALVEGLSSNMPQIVQAVTKITQTLISALGTFMPMLISNGGELVLAVVSGVIESLPDVARSALDLIVTLADTLIDNLPVIIDSAYAIITQIATTLGESLPELIPKAVELVLTLANALTNPDSLNHLIEGALNVVIGLADGIIAALPELIKQAPVIILNLVNAIVGNLPKIVQAGLDILLAILDAITSPEGVMILLEAAFQLVVGLVDAIAPLAEKLGEVGADFIFKLIDGIKGKWEDLFEIGREMFDKLREKIAEKINDAKQWGRDLIDNFVNGIKETINKVKDAVSDAAQKVKEFLGFSEPEKGPLSNFHTFAPDMMELFAQGIKDNEDLVTAQIDRSFDIKSHIVNADNVGGIKSSSGVTMNVYAKAQTPAELLRETKSFYTREAFLNV